MSGYFAINLDGLGWNLKAPITDLSRLGSPDEIAVTDPLDGTMLLSATAVATRNWMLTSAPRAMPTGWVMGDAWYVYLPSSVPQPAPPLPYALPAATSGTQVLGPIRTAMGNGTDVLIQLASGPFTLNGATLPFVVVGRKPRTLPG